MTTNYIIDWFTFSGKIPDNFCNQKEKYILDFIGLYDLFDNFEVISGKNFYSSGLGLYYIDNNKKKLVISIYIGSLSSDLDFYVNFTGIGCRLFESYTTIDFNYLFKKVIDLPNYNISRCDVALDILESDINYLYNMTKSYMNGDIVHRAKYTEMISNNNGGFSLYFGKRSSNVCINIYNKASERQISGTDWLRLELRLRHEHAYNFISDYVSNMSLGILFWSVLNNYIDFKIPSNDSNKSRLDSVSWWSDLKETTSVISISSFKGLEYNLNKLNDFVFSNSGSSILTYILINGEKSLIDNLLNSNVKLTNKQQLLIKQYLNEV